VVSSFVLRKQIHYGVCKSASSYGETTRQQTRKKMGKRYKHLLEPIADMDNLRSAYLKTVRGGNRYTTGHLRFKENLEANLVLIQKQLLDGSYKRGKLTKFEVFEPKKREITSLQFRDRVVQHAIHNIVGPLFERMFYSCTYACREGKGTHKGVKEVQATIRRMEKQGEVFYLKMDFSKYFKSVVREILFREYGKKISDQRVLELMRGFEDEEVDGISIGFLLSQLGANLYGHIFDRFIKTRLHVKHYFRYMDDTVVLSHDKEYLRKLQRKLRLFAHLYMKMRFSKWHIDKISARPLNFLGYRITGGYKLIRKDSVTRAKRKLKRFVRLELLEPMLKFLAAWIGHVRWADSFNLLNHLRKEYKRWKTQYHLSIAS